MKAVGLKLKVVDGKDKVAGVNIDDRSVEA